MNQPYTSPNICPVCKEYRDDLGRCRCTSGLSMNTRKESDVTTVVPPEA